MSKNAFDSLFPGVVLTIGDRVVTVKPWTVRMVMKDVPYVVSRIFDRLRESGEVADVGSIVEVLSLSADEVVDIICRSVEPQMTKDEFYDLPAHIGVELLNTILELNKPFFSKLQMFLEGLRSSTKS